MAWRSSASRAVFSADKVWTSSGGRGRAQIEASRAIWGVPRFDLLQVHNLVAWQEHLRDAVRDEGRGRAALCRHHHLGRPPARAVRADHARRSRSISCSSPTTSLDREAEERLLPLARDRGIAVMVNRPFRQGALIRRLEREPLPGWAAEIGCTSWAQFILKFIVSHPAVTCRDPGDDPRRPCPREHCRRSGPAARRGDATAHGGPYQRALMQEWWTYRPADFLLFSPRTYWRLFELATRRSGRCRSRRF